MLPLVVLARTASHNKALAQALAQYYKAQGTACPPIQAFEPLALCPKPVDGLGTALAEACRADLIFCVSSFAFRCFEQALRAHGLGLPTAALWAAVGPGTARAYWQAGIAPQRTVLPTGSQDAESLWSTLSPTAGQHWVLVTGDPARPWLAEQARAHGLYVQTLALYHRQPADLSGIGVILQQAMATTATPSSLWCIGSAQSVQQVAQALRQQQLLSLWSQAYFITPHERVNQAILAQVPPECRQAAFACQSVASAPEDWLQAIVQRLPRLSLPMVQ